MMAFNEVGKTAAIYKRKQRRVASGQAAEDWIAFAAEQGDRRPLLFFDPSSAEPCREKRVLFSALQVKRRGSNRITAD
jgi:hypothetical protein